MWRLAVHAVGFPERLGKVIDVVIAQSYVVDWQICLWSEVDQRSVDVLVILVGDRCPVGMPVLQPSGAPKWTAELRVGECDQWRTRPLLIARQSLFSQLTQALVTVAELMRQHQGVIPKSVESPCAANWPSKQNAEASNLALVVDQHPQARQLISAELTAMGFRVLTAANAEQALTTAQGQALTLAVIDTDLPESMDGIQLGRMLREQSNPPVSVLMLSNHGDNLDRLRALVSGTHAYLIKPVDRLMFRTEIHRMLAHARTPISLESSC